MCSKLAGRIDRFSQQDDECISNVSRDPVYIDEVRRSSDRVIMPQRDAKNGDQYDGPPEKKSMAIRRLFVGVAVEALENKRRKDGNLLGSVI